MQTIEPDFQTADQGPEPREALAKSRRRFSGKELFRRGSVAGVLGLVALLTGCTGIQTKGEKEARRQIRERSVARGRNIDKRNIVLTVLTLLTTLTRVILRIVPNVLQDRGSV